jgi:hypothetical protein
MPNQKNKAVEDSRHNELYGYVAHKSDPHASNHTAGADRSVSALTLENWRAERMKKTNDEATNERTDMPKPKIDEYARATQELALLIGTLKDFDKETSQCSLSLIAASTFLQQKNFGSVLTSLQIAYAKVLILKKLQKKSAVLQTTGEELTSTGIKNYLQEYITLIIGMVKNIPAPATSAAPRALKVANAQLRLMRACLDARETMF